MKKIVLAVLAAASLCALSACSTYTEATGPNGTTVRHVLWRRKPVRLQ